MKYETHTEEGWNGTLLSQEKVKPQILPTGIKVYGREAN